MLFGLFRRRRRIRIDVASLCECGPVRAENQDRVLVNRRGLVFCVADGMGGGEGGGEASAIVCRELAAVLRRRTDFVDRVHLVDEAIRRADEMVRAYAAKAGYRQMGSTVTVLVGDPEDGRSAIVGNIGDSRVYCLHGDEFRQLTRDHTMESEILRRSGARGGAPSLLEARASALSHVLTRAVGVGDDVHADWRKVDLFEGDVFLVCSDGVHGAMPQDVLKDALAQGGRASEMVERIRRAVLASGAADNFSAVVVKIGGAQ